MSIQIRYATEADGPALGQINIDSFKHQRYWSNVFPGLDDAAIHPVKHFRSLEKMADPTVHVLSAVDTAAGDRVVGYARWTIPGESNPNVVTLSEEAKKTTADMSSVLPAGMSMPIYRDFFTKMKKYREEYVKEDDMILDFLATSPSAQGKGVGTRLLRWGMDQADARNARIYLEATADGYPLYRKHGWTVLREMEMDFEPFGGKGTQTYYLMMRERQRA